MLVSFSIGFPPFVEDISMKFYNDCKCASLSNENRNCFRWLNAEINKFFCNTLESSAGSLEELLF